MKEQILAMLKESDDYVSGQELCSRFSVSRTAIWKAVNSLKESGYDIEAVRNRGYRLISCPDVLLSEEIKSLLKTEWFGKNILYFESVDSTSNEIKRQAENGAPHGTLAIAETQTAGKGRRTRSWFAPPFQGIWMSFLMRPELPPHKASMITLVTALAAAEAVEEESGLETQIKWPNDIVVNGKKIIGILTEMNTEMTCINYVITGIGINVNIEEFPDEIKNSATSIFMECGHKIKRSRIVAFFGEKFEKYYGLFCREGSLSPVKEAYENRLINKNNEVYIIEGGTKTICTAMGITDYGELVVKDKEGEIKHVISGEVSVRGIYGYV